MGNVMKERSGNVIAAVALGFLLSAGVASAQTVPQIRGTVPVDVVFEIENSCTITGDGLLDFGTVGAGVTANNIDAQSAGLTIVCGAPNPNTQISIDAGNNAIGIQRHMKAESGKRIIPYELYRDPGRTIRYDTAPPVPCPRPCTGGGGIPLPSGPFELVVYGQIPAGTLLSNGRYSDATNVTVDF